MIFNNMIGKVMSSVTGQIGDSEMVFTSIDGKTFKFLHYLQCCETVTIEDIIGDLSDLIGSTIVQAEEVSSEQTSTRDNSGTWTFYKFATQKGYVAVRWFGSANRYSESVDYEES